MPSRLLSPLKQESPNWLNRRVAVRHRCGRGTTSKLVAVGELRVRQGRVKDISLGGIGLLLCCPLKSGTRLLIQIKNARAGIAYDLAARVVHSFRKPRNQWLVGCAFARELSQFELDQLL